MQQQIVAHNSVYDTLKFKKELVYTAPCAASAVIAKAKDADRAKVEKAKAKPEAKKAI